MIQLLVQGFALSVVALAGAGPQQLQSRALGKVASGWTLDSNADAPDDFGVELAGVPTLGFPEFTFVQAFNVGDTVQIGVDTHRIKGLINRELDVYVVLHRSPDEWRLNRELQSVNGGSLSMLPTLTGLADNQLTVDPGGLSAASATAQLGIGYDIVLDVNRNGILDADDHIDGWGALAGFYVMPRLMDPGPYATSMSRFNGGRFRRQEIFYPSNIASLGELPLVMISHGNGHNYRWYDHLGEFLASWGYIVCSHENLTAPGIQSASESTLTNTDVLLNNLDISAGGQLLGHVDKNTIIWIGHSRGGEGVAWAYNQLVNDPPFATTFSADDIKLVSSIAPTDFLGTGVSDPLDVPFHLWTGGADADVNGCSADDIAQTFHLHDRAQGERMSISLHGAGHGDFHNGGGSSVASGPCLLGRARTHRVMKGYLLPLIDSVLNDSAHSREYLWRQYESFTPLNNPSRCVVADLMYRPDPSLERFVLDDFQKRRMSNISSSGGQVLWNVENLVEGRLDDRNATFTGDTPGLFNGITLGSRNDDSKGIVFEFGNFSSNFIRFQVPEGKGDVSGFAYLSFRACQITRSALTVAELGDVNFTVVLSDSQERSSEVRIGAYGGGIEEPYLRRGCGAGRGWTSEWETIRIPIVDFTASGRALNMRDITSVGFRFGSDHGSSLGKLGLDEIEFVSK